MESQELTSDELGEIKKQLIDARHSAYAPYSNFKVGAIIYIRDSQDKGTSFQSTFVPGCNIENASYGATMCAERVAIYKAISSNRTHETVPGNWTCLALVGDLNGPNEVITPCGMCRQVINEFVRDKTGFPVLMFSPDLLTCKTSNIHELLPLAFGPDSLQ